LCKLSKLSSLVIKKVKELSMETIIYPLLGGVLIGLSSSTMLGGIGRITGISGIIAGSMHKPKTENLWRYFFLVGLILGAIIMKYYRPDLFNYNIEFPMWKVLISGLLVGFGTRLGGGCTSGHGVCGMARMAKRSFVATATFIGFGILTVFVRGLL
jgi:uncharacterized membrane protein YedE/YeeE